MLTSFPCDTFFLHIDGTTAGRKRFTEPIGISPTVYKELHITSYEPISLLQPLPHVEHWSDVPVSDASSSQWRTLSVIYGIAKSRTIEPLAIVDNCHQNSPPLYWAPSNIRNIGTFIIQVYAPTWFTIKTQPSCNDGAKHMHGMMVSTRDLSSSLKKVVDLVTIYLTDNQLKDMISSQMSPSVLIFRFPCHWKDAWM